MKRKLFDFNTYAFENGITTKGLAAAKVAFNSVAVFYAVADPTRCLEPFDLASILNGFAHSWAADEALRRRNVSQKTKGKQNVKRT